MSETFIPDDVLIAHALGELDSAATTDLERTLSRSPETRARLTQYRDLIAATRVPDAVSPPPDVLLTLLTTQAARRVSWSENLLGRLRPERLAPLALAATLVLTLLGSGMNSGGPTHPELDALRAQAPGTEAGYSAASLATPVPFAADALVGRPAPRLTAATLHRVPGLEGGGRERSAGWQSLAGDSGSTHDSL